MAKNTPAEKLDKKPIVFEKIDITLDAPVITFSGNIEIKSEVITTVACAPYCLRARQDTTFMKFDEDKKLIYKDIYRRGQEVKGVQKVFDILASKQANQFIKINVGDA